MGEQIYFLVQFPFNEFLNFINVDTKSAYQRNKVLKFFEDFLFIKPFVSKFSREEFRSALLFPYVESIKKGKTLYIFIPIHFFSQAVFYHIKVNTIYKLNLNF